MSDAVVESVTRARLPQGCPLNSIFVEPLLKDHGGGERSVTPSGERAVLLLRPPESLDGSRIPCFFVQSDTRTTGSCCSPPAYFEKGGARLPPQLSWVATCCGS